MADLIETNRGDSVSASQANEVLEKLEEIRARHVGTKNAFNANQTPPSTFATDVESAGELTTTDYPFLIKEYITKLEQSSFIPEIYSEEVNIPNIGDLLSAVNDYNHYVDIANRLDALCANNADYSVCQNYSGAFNDYWNYT